MPIGAEGVGAIRVERREGAGYQLQEVIGRQRKQVVTKERKLHLRMCSQAQIWIKLVEGK